MTELVVEDVHLSYGANPVLKGVSMRLQQGEIVTLLGASGSGKTTLLRAVAGLEHANQGRITLDGKALFDAAARVEVPAEARNLGIVFQSYALWPHKTVIENIAYPLKLRKVARAERFSRAQEIINHLGLATLERRYPSELSGGQQQRVAIGRALIYNPPVLLLDEPLSNLDAKLRAEARGFLRELIMSLGLAAIMVTHDQAEAMAVSDRILLLSNGQINQQGTPQEVYDTPHTRFCAEFMGNNNRLTGTVSALEGGMAVLDGPGWSVRGRGLGGVAAGQAAIAIVRIERVEVGGAQTPNSVQLPLTSTMYLGDRWEYRFRAPGAGSIADALALRAYGSTDSLPDPCFLHLPPEVVWIFPA